MMSFDIVEMLKSKASLMACHSVLYDWSLSDKTPDRLIVRPADLWSGDKSKAEELLEAAGVGERTGPLWDDSWWEPQGADMLWITHMHGFTWLRDLRTLSTPIAREQGRLMIESWIDTYGCWDEKIWKNDLTGVRLTMWISHYDFFNEYMEEEFEEKFLSSIIKQAKHLSNMPGAVSDPKVFDGARGLLYASVALEGHHAWIAQALESIRLALDVQIHPDGGHASRSPERVQDVLESLVDIKSALNAADHEIPDFLNEGIERISGALRFFRYGDRGLAVFNEAQEGSSEALDFVLAQAGVRNKESKSLSYTGYERLEQGRAVLMMDVGKAPKPPFDKDAHASANAFEFCYGKERILVSCGTHPISPEWNEALRFTAAHNTACLDMRNSCEIKKDGCFGRKVTEASVHREDTKEASLLVAAHNGYVPLNGITHSRKLYLSDEGHDLRGEDHFTCAFDLVNPVDMALRFHIHPGVSVSLIHEGKEVLLRVPGGMGWRFKHSSGALALEDSLYLGEGLSPRKTKQIVIYGTMSEDEASIKWALKKEG